MSKFFPNWKQLLWIVVFAVASVLLRSNFILANWVWWVLAFVFVGVYELLSTKGDKGDKPSDEQ